MLKILWFFVILIVLYLMLVFQFTEIATKIDGILWIWWTSDKILYLRDVFYDIFTYFPTKEEVTDVYKITMSWAEVVKDTIIIGLDKTKDQVDNLRNTLSGAEDSYNATKQLINSSSWKIQEVIDIVGNIKNLSGSGVTSTGIIQ